MDLSHKANGMADWNSAGELQFRASFYNTQPFFSRDPLTFSDGR